MRHSKYEINTLSVFAFISLLIGNFYLFYILWQKFFLPNSNSGVGNNNAETFNSKSIDFNGKTTIRIFGKILI